MPGHADYVFCLLSGERDRGARTSSPSPTARICRPPASEDVASALLVPLGHVGGPERQEKSDGLEVG